MQEGASAVGTVMVLFPSVSGDVSGEVLEEVENEPRALAANNDAARSIQPVVLCGYGSLIRSRSLGEARLDTDSIGE